MRYNKSVTHRFPALTGALGLAEHLGTVTEGKLADLIVVDGDPPAEPAPLSGPGRIWLVWQQGVPVVGQDYNERSR